MNRKICGKCKIPKHVSNFKTRGPSRPGILQSYCMPCVREASALRRAQKGAELNAQSAKIRRDNRDLYNAKEREYRKKYPLKSAARKAARRALKKGIIVRTGCIHCGDPKSEMHHPDYSKPLEILWLCKPCHGLLHKQERIAG